MESLLSGLLFLWLKKSTTVKNGAGVARLSVSLSSVGHIPALYLASLLLPLSVPVGVSVCVDGPNYLLSLAP